MTPQEEIDNLKQKKSILEAYLVQIIEAWVNVDINDKNAAAALFHQFAESAPDILAETHDYEPKQMTTIINVHDAPRGWQEDNQYVYIGRKNTQYNVPQSKWHNPFRVHGPLSRHDVIEAFREYLMLEPELLADLHELQGKILVCWCAPLPCHGDILIDLVKTE